MAGSIAPTTRAKVGPTSPAVASRPGGCTAHRRRVRLASPATAALTPVLAAAAGRHYAPNRRLPGTEAQRALNLLPKEFTTQSGDLDTIVVHTARGTIDSPTLR